MGFLYPISLSLSFFPVSFLSSLSCFAFIYLTDEDYTPLSMINAIGTTKLDGERPDYHR
jgi:hypothetical protein